MAASGHQLALCGGAFVVVTIVIVIVIIIVNDVDNDTDNANDNENDNAVRAVRGPQFTVQEVPSLPPGAPLFTARGGPVYRQGEPVYRQGLIYEVKNMDNMYVDMIYSRQLTSLGSELKDKITSLRTQLDNKLKSS